MAAYADGKPLKLRNAGAKSVGTSAMAGMVNEWMGSTIVVEEASGSDEGDSKKAEHALMLCGGGATAEDC